MNLLIEVTTKDIQLGKRGHDTTCPIARAVRRVTRLRKIAVGEDRITDCTGLPVAFLPRRAKEFIRRFDAHKPVKPFSFKLSLKEANN